MAFYVTLVIVLMTLVSNFTRYRRPKLLQFIQICQLLKQSLEYFASYQFGNEILLSWMIDIWMKNHF
jgi:hypothetical protein